MTMITDNESGKRLSLREVCRFLNAKDHRPPVPARATEPVDHPPESVGNRLVDLLRERSEPLLITSAADSLRTRTDWLQWFGEHDSRFRLRRPQSNGRGERVPLISLA